MPLRPPPDAEDRLRGIRSVTDAALSHLGADDLLATLLGRVREILDADTAAVLLLDSSGRQLIATAASGLEEAALAVQSLRSREDQAAALALQRSLVPSAPPAVRGAEIAARYVPGSGRVGGDWYDVFVLPSGELGMVVGDVAGSGLGAAVIMGRIRSALRAYALEFPGPADVLVKLDQKMQYFEEGDVMATVSYAVFDPGSGQLHVSSAGHSRRLSRPPASAAP
jgi:phosphoserine phosphatase RsbU/P